MKDAKDLEITRNIWDDIIHYEKSWLKTHSANVPVAKLMEYFGRDTICALHGCTVATDAIARELIIEAFK